MKLPKILSTSLALLVVLSACDNENFVEENVDRGAMVFISQKDQDTGLVNFIDPDQTRLNFEVSMTDEQGRNLEFAPVESIDVTATFTNGSTGTTHKAIIATITEWPQTLDLGINDLVGPFSENTLTRDSLDLGDSFFITADFNMQDGRKLSGWSPSLLDNSAASIYRVFVNYLVACPSEIPTGTWVEIGENDVSEATLTELNPGIYEFSDFNVNYYGAGSSPIRGVFADICNTLSLQGATDFGVQWRGTGVYDPVNQTITFQQVEDVAFSPGSFAGPYVFEFRGE
ncbi:hypothetical protein [Tunicatimonas pelagia]|uniref:hypothetical protein n=1 Tax=Tunicatimonas pelagia TaxID=931531 RepID=UPI0026658587|nr:hypothetical protein [Tunicatimonas pelagia]WKN41757.1 hypothetical protein P0M28_22220 [Tunicatimonas pelagia]